MNNQRKVTGTITIEGAKLIFKNFSGKKTDYNDEGKKNFGLLLDPELAEEMEADGWPVKYRPPREDDPDQFAQPWISVKVKFGPYPPVVQLIKSNGKIKLTEDNIGQLDWSIIENADLVITPYNYPAMRGKPAGVTAYLKALYATIADDYLYKKYSNIPDLDGDDIPIYDDPEGQELMEDSE